MADQKTAECGICGKPKALGREGIGIPGTPISAVCWREHSEVGTPGREECYRLGCERLQAKLEQAVRGRDRELYEKDEELGATRRSLYAAEGARDTMVRLLTPILNLVIRWHNIYNTTTQDRRDDGLTGILDELQAKLDAALAAESGKPGGAGLSNFQRGEQFMRQRIADVLPEAAEWILKLPLIGDPGASADVDAIMRTARDNVKELVRDTDATRPTAETMNFVLDAPRAAPPALPAELSGKGEQRACRDCGAIGIGVYHGMCDRCGGNGAEPGEAKKEEGGRHG